MIRFEHTRVMNFDGALRGMRNPLNSWDKSDSVDCGDFEGRCSDCEFFKRGSICNGVSDSEIVVIGENDLKLAKKLIRAGSDHRKFMRQILVSVDITAPLYWWKEFDTYKVGTVANSCSTMHKIHAKEFTLKDFSNERLLCWDVNQDVDNPAIPIGCLSDTVKVLNACRDKYLETKDKMFWEQLIQLLPSSYNQKRTVTLNYETLYNIYGSRKNHKLDEWSKGFINWIESLPYAKELIIEREA